MVLPFGCSLLKAAAERVSAAEGVSLNQLINIAVAETEDFFKVRAKRSKHEAFLKFLDEAGDEPRVEGDELR